MVLSEITVKLTDDATTLVYNALGLVPASEFEDAKTEVINKLNALQTGGTKPSPEEVIIAFVDTLDDVAHETDSTKFQTIADIIDKIVNEVAGGTFNIFKGLVDAIKLKKAANSTEA